MDHDYYDELARAERIKAYFAEIDQIDHICSSFESIFVEDDTIQGFSNEQCAAIVEIGNAGVAALWERQNEVRKLVDDFISKGYMPKRKCNHVHLH